MQRKRGGGSGAGGAHGGISEPSIELSEVLKGGWCSRITQIDVRKWQEKKQMLDEFLVQASGVRIVAAGDGSEVLELVRTIRILSQDSMVLVVQGALRSQIFPPQICTVAHHTSMWAGNSLISQANPGFNFSPKS